MDLLARVLVLVLVAAGTSCLPKDDDDSSPSRTDGDAPVGGMMVVDAAHDFDGSPPGPLDGAVDAARDFDGTPPQESLDAAPPPEDARLQRDGRPAPVPPLPPGCIAEGMECSPNPPDNDQVGQVCANDGEANEAYCVYDRRGRMVCARMENGGQCESAPEPDGPGPDVPDPVAGDFAPAPLAADDPLARYFAQQVTVFGVRIVGTARVPAAKISHAAHLMAEYLDNDEDGTVDDPPVARAMVQQRALLVMFADSDELESSRVFDSNVIDGFHSQDLQGDETNPPNGFDAGLEEVLHLITTAGYEQVYPMAFGSRAGTLLTDAMDQARGGRFERTPDPYPEGAWYHYDDATCDYGCMAVEYFYWALTTLLGAHSDRCAEINSEWELCTAEALAGSDLLVHALLTDRQYHLPRRLPDGRYAPAID